MTYQKDEWECYKCYETGNEGWCPRHLEHTRFALYCGRGFRVIDTSDGVSLLYCGRGIRVIDRSDAVSSECSCHSHCGRGIRVIDRVSDYCSSFTSR